MLASDLPTNIKGLSSQTASERLAKFGPNEPATTRHYSALGEFLSALAAPLVLILLCAAVISMFVGEAVDASLIISIVVIGVTINFAQSHRSQRAAERLREQVSPTATVLRDGTWLELCRREIVPGERFGFPQATWFPRMRVCLRLVTCTFMKRLSRASRCRPKSLPVMGRQAWCSSAPRS